MLNDNKLTIVHKYGGSSVATKEQIQAIANHIKKICDKGTKVVVVASAMGKTTNKLIEEAASLSKKPSKRDLDLLLCTGEMQTVSLLSICLNGLGVRSVAFTGFQAGIVTNDNYNRAFIESLDIAKINNALQEVDVVVVAGFQGITRSGEITTLGRGGSDTTAVAIASMLNCACEIYTDVDAVRTIDPNLFKDAKSIHSISYDEMMEMSVNGAKVLEARSVELAKKNGVKLYLGKTLNEDKEKGTYVGNVEKFEDMPITSLSIKEHMCVLNLKIDKQCFKQVAKVFEVIEICGLNLEMISQIIYDEQILFSFSMPKEKLDEVINALEERCAFTNSDMFVVNDLCKVTLVGVGIATHAEICKKLFHMLYANKVLVGHINVSEIAVSFTVKEEDVSTVISSVAKEFKL